ncbi:MAG: hypothetical protein WCS94_02970 [Verrucomicrobiota bacterium]
MNPEKLARLHGYYPVNEEIVEGFWERAAAAAAHSQPRQTSARSVNIWGECKAIFYLLTGWLENRIAAKKGLSMFRVCGLVSNVVYKCNVCRNWQPKNRNLRGLRT